MRVRFLRGTALGGVGNDATPGDERDLPDTQAVQLVALGRAVEVVAVAPAPTLDPATAPADAPKPTRKKGK